MTLCIALRRSDGSLLSIADSRLTLENRGKKWITDLAVKIHYATQESTIYAATRFDVVFSVSGALLLGLQSILYVDACLKGESGTWSDGIINVINNKLWDFWEEAISKDITYSICLHDHKGRARIFEWHCLGSSSLPTYQEVEATHGLLLTVHGDGADLVRERILAEVQSCSYSECDLQDVLAYASIRALQAVIENNSNPSVGGQVQACLLTGHVAEHLVCRGVSRYLRSAQISEYEGYEYRTLDLAHPWLDRSQPLARLVSATGATPPLIIDPR